MDSFKLDPRLGAGDLPRLPENSVQYEYGWMLHWFKLPNDLVSTG